MEAIFELIRAALPLVGFAGVLMVLTSKLRAKQAPTEEVGAEAKPEEPVAEEVHFYGNPGSGWAQHPAQDKKWAKTHLGALVPMAREHHVWYCPRENLLKQIDALLPPYINGQILGYYGMLFLRTRQVECLPENHTLWAYEGTNGQVMVGVGKAPVSA